ncbi:ATP-binding protein [Antrihabitans sp. YC2-6]|uniref:ATP-binding protein n=1 Tax=Antrihabitans sp. YC2-6 TaxID=2799498 RepID=UPI0018F2A8A4|nr:ATP-binding protein [Antrihabitans sp. YC2-6]MBJ8344985.1 ATP-binding protein [Antrihabitans sp. YC2-6]
MAGGIGGVLTRPRDRIRATERVTRSLACTLGLGSAIYGFMDFPEIVQQAVQIEPWWTPAAVVAFFGSGLVISYVAVRGELSALRRVLIALLGIYLVCCLTLPLAAEFGSLDGKSAWIWRVAPIAIVAAALTWRPAGTAAYGLLAGVVSTAVNCYAVGESGFLGFAEFLVRNSCSASVFAWVVVCAMRATVLLDEASARAEKEAAVTAANAARARERSRFAALIHDGVLSTLLDASRGQESRSLSAQARRTLREINEFRSGEGDRTVFDEATATGFLRVSALQAGRTVRFTSRRTPGAAELSVPVAAAESIAAAMSESIRNSIRHAGACGGAVDREVTATVERRGLRVEIADDGVGFEPDSVPAHRMGVALSILGRMAELPGGAAAVESARGRGTKVTLTWASDDRG